MELNTFNKDYDTLNNPENISSISQIIIRNYTDNKEHKLTKSGDSAYKSTCKSSISKPFSSSIENVILNPKEAPELLEQKQSGGTPILKKGKNYKLASLMRNSIKSKTKEKNMNFTVKQKKNDVKKERYDYNGNIISKKNRRKVHITFLDEIDKQPINKIIEIESFKKYNIMVGLPKEDYYYGNVAQCCCFVF